MLNYQNTIWMGNIQRYMDSNYLQSLLSSLNITPKKINVKININKPGYAFLEFESRATAENVLKNFKGKIINGFQLKLNWSKPANQNNSMPLVKKFTVSFLYNSE